MLAGLSRWTLPPLIIGAALLLYRVVGVERATEDLLPPSVNPRRIEPKRQEPRIVTDEQLRAVLERVKPPHDPVNTNNFVHALRLWGPEAKFEAGVPTGEELRSFFLDDEVFQRYAGKDAVPLFMLGPDGVRIRDYDENYANRFTSSFHADDILATLAETGTSLDTPIVTRAGSTTVRDLLVASMRRFHLDRHEFEWSVITYGRYLFPLKDWKNQFGEKIDLAGMVQRCVERPGQGPCKGLHRFEAIVILLRADEEANALSPRTRRGLIEFLKSAVNQLTAAQSTEGSWSAAWIKGAAGNDVKKVSLDERILVTGHTLEWLALAPEEVQPPRETIVRAGQWLANTMIGLDQKTLTDHYGPYSHAARALCLWRGKEAYPMWRQLQDSVEHDPMSDN